MYIIKKDEPIMRDNTSSEGLKQLISELGDTSKMRMIEIGSFIGESTIIFAEYFKEVIAIDPFQPDYHKEDPTSKFNFDEVFEEYVRRIESEKEKVTTYKLTSNDALSLLQGEKFDFIYIDGIHQYENVYEDIMNYLPLVKEGGIIGGHDYGGPWKGVQQAVDQVFGQPDKVFKDTSWIKQL
jgi:predicted O-methyltransferase YrrM